jgi:anti-repressor protein
MTELIKVHTNNQGIEVVSARELHQFLEVATEPILWCKRMFDYGFIKDVDYTAIKSENPVNKRLGTVDYALTLDCAKELSMLQRTDKGKEARQYFIAREKQAKELEKQQLPQDYLSALKALVSSEEQKQLAQAEVKELKPKAEGFDTFINSNSLQGFKEVANVLGLGRNTLMKKLRELKIITSKNIPYQNYLSMGLFEVKESTQNGFNTATTYVTPKGVDYIRTKIN